MTAHVGILVILLGGAFLLQTPGNGVAQTGSPTSSETKSRTPPTSQEAIRDPFKFIKTGWAHGLPYIQARESIGPDALPRLYAALKDPAHAQSWSMIAVLIGYLGNDERAAGAIMEYVQRAENWKDVPVERQYFQAVLKVQCLVWAGKMSDERTSQQLIRALRPEGAEALLKNWIDGPLPDRVTRAKLVELAQGHAAKGLIMDGRAVGAKAVEKEYAELHAKVREDKNLGQLHAAYVDAMAARDAIAELGKEGYLQTYGTRRHVDVLVKYFPKYR